MPGESAMAPDFNLICREAERSGLVCRGGFHPTAEDGVPGFTDGTMPATVMLFGFVGSRQWPVFAASTEFLDGRPNALDRWSRRVIDALGECRAARGLYPSDGPPWLPFQRWARRAEPVHSSPLGILIHPRYGLWHAYRGALAFRERLRLPERIDGPSPCTDCRDKPCLGGCPVAAVTPDHFDHRACIHHVASAAGTDCLALGCLARRQCPVGSAYRYRPDQAEFHMAAFRHA